MWSVRTVTKAGADAHLTVKEYALLRLLLQHRGKVITHRQLLREVWGPGHEDDTHYLRVHMANLRRKIEAATGRTPKYIGKPNAEMIRMGMAKIAAVPEKTAMIGDRLYTDMQMAYNAGITSVLVLSGETKIADLEGADRQPDYVFASVRELHEALDAADQE